MFESLELFYRWLLSKNLPEPIRILAQGTSLMIRRLLQDQVHVRAATLSYWSLVAVVPVLVLAAVVLRAIGLDGSDFREIMYRTLLAGSVSGVGNQIDSWVGELDFGRLGIVGVLGVLWTGSRIFFQAEDAYNHIWGSKVQRGLMGRLLLFYAGVTLGPLVLAWGFHMTGELAVDHSMIDRLSPITLSTFAFVAAIRLLPDTRVLWLPAVVGGFWSGLMFEIGKAGFNEYISILGATSTAVRVYGSIALFPIFMLWLYILWLIVLLGVELAYIVQHWRMLRKTEERRLSGERELVPDGWLAVQVVAAVVQWFQQRRGPCPAMEIGNFLGLDARALDLTLEILGETGILARSGVGWLPARPEIRVGEVVRVWRSRVLPPALGPGSVWVGEELSREEWEMAVEQIAGKEVRR